MQEYRGRQVISISSSVEHRLKRREMNLRNTNTKEMVVTIVRTIN